MYESANSGTIKYKQMFEEAFEGLTNEVENLNLNFENYNGTGYNIKSINECENVNDYKVNLFFLKRQAMKTIKEKSEELPQDEQTGFLKYVKMRLNKSEILTNKKKKT